MGEYFSGVEFGLSHSFLMEFTMAKNLLFNIPTFASSINTLLSDIMSLHFFEAGLDFGSLVHMLMS